MYLVNATSWNMCDSDITIQKRTLIEQPKDLSVYESAIGHKATADLLGVETNRLTLKMHKGDKVLLVQYEGDRLEEGTTVLPVGSTLTWYEVEFL